MPDYSIHTAAGTAGVVGAGVALSPEPIPFATAAAFLTGTLAADAGGLMYHAVPVWRSFRAWWWRHPLRKKLRWRGFAIDTDDPHWRRRILKRIDTQTYWGELYKVSHSAVGSLSMFGIAYFGFGATIAEWFLIGHVLTHLMPDEASHEESWLFYPFPQPNWYKKFRQRAFGEGNWWKQWPFNTWWWKWLCAPLLFAACVAVNYVALWHPYIFEYIREYILQYISALT